jgi:hypothetical protein
VASLWFGLAHAIYGDLDQLLMKQSAIQDWQVALFFASYFGAAAAAWVGGTVGPLLLGAKTYRGSVLHSSAFGGFLSAVGGSMAGFVVGVICLWYDPLSDLGIWIPLGLGLPIGAVGGWRAARFFDPTQLGPYPRSGRLQA